jgi:hypothetical protein
MKTKTIKAKSYHNIPTGYTGIVKWEGKENKGDVSYYQEGLLHRDDGPAEITVSGIGKVEIWNNHGRIHRADGPAIVHDNGEKEFFLYNDNYPDEDEYWEVAWKLFQDDPIKGPRIMAKMLARKK